MNIQITFVKERAIPLCAGPSLDIDKYGNPSQPPLSKHFAKNHMWAFCRPGGGGHLLVNKRLTYKRR